MKDLIKVQEYEENAFIELIKKEQEVSKKPIDVADIRKKFHFKQLAKKSKINTIVGTTSSISTLAVLAYSRIVEFYCTRFVTREQEDKKDYQPFQQNSRRSNVKRRKHFNETNAG